MIDYTLLTTNELKEEYAYLDEDAQMSDAHNVWENNHIEMRKIKRELDSRNAKL